MKRWIVFLLITAILFSMVGCGGGEPPSEPRDPERDVSEGPDNEMADEYVESVEREIEAGELDREAQPVDDFFQFESVFELATHFKELEYSYTVDGAEGRTGITNYSFSVLDEKSIDGKKAYQVKYQRTGQDDESIIECWVNEDQVLEGTMDGNVLEDQELLMINATLGSFMMPFVFTMVMEATLTNREMREMMGWEILDEGTKSSSMGGVNTEVRYYELEAEDETAYFEVATISGQSLFMGYKNTNQQGNTYEMTVTNLELK